MEYINRKSELDTEKYFSLTDTGISDGDIGIIPYEEIRLVQLQYIQAHNRRGFYQCLIHGTGGQEWKLVSRRYLGIGRFANQLPEYRDFLLELHRKLAHYPQIRFMAGLSKASYYGELVGTILVVGLLSAVLTAFTAGIALILIPFLLYWRVVPYFRKNRPAAYQPSNPPAELLGASR